MKNFVKYLIGFILLVLVIFIIFAAIVIYSFKYGDIPEKPFDTEYVLDSLKLTDKKYYQLGGYRIYPGEKTVLVYSDNYSPCYIDTLINFDSTALVFYGNKLDFKEHLDSLIDYNTLKVLHYEIGKEYYYPSVCKDKNYIYIDLQEKEDISGYKNLNDCIYLNNDNEIFYLTKSGDLGKMDIHNEKPYLTDLEYLSDGCFYNKDGLFELQRQYNYEDERNVWFTVPVKVKSSNGRKIIPDIKRFYFTYGNDVYLRGNNTGRCRQEFQKLDLDAIHVKQFMLSEFDCSFILTDGKKSYIYPEKIRNKINTGSIARWIQLSDDNIRFRYEKKTNTLYYALNKNSESGQFTSMHGALFHIDGNFWIISMSGKEEGKGNMFSLDKVMINAGNGYEELDINNYRYISDDLYIYKGILYGNLCQTIDSYKELDLPNLKPLKHNDVSSCYYTDNKLLFYHNPGYERQRAQDGTIYPHIVENVDFSSLKVVTERMLIDKNNIYNGAIVIPIDSLGVKVEVYN